MVTSTANTLAYASSIELTYAVIDRQNHGLVVLDAKGVIQLWNDWMQTWTGIERRHALGKIFLDLFPPLHGSDYAKAIFNTISNHQNQTWFLDCEPELLDAIEASLSRRDRALPLARIDISAFFHASQSGCLLEFSEAPYNALHPTFQANGLKQTLQSNVEHEHAFVASIETEKFGVVAVNAEGFVRAVNDGMTRITGYSQGQLLNQHLSLVFPSLDGCDDICLNMEAATRLHRDGLIDAIDSEGKNLPLKVSVFQNPLRENMLTLVCDDFSQQQGNQDALLQQRELLAAIYGEVADGIILLDTMGRVEHINPVALEMLGVRTTVVEGALADDLFMLVSGDEGRVVCPHREVLNRGTACQRPDKTFLHVSGQPALQVIASAEPLRDRENHLSGCVLILRITSQASRESVKLSWHVDHDPLTQLPNRHFLESELTRAIEGTQASGKKHVLLYLDLYNFALVNDTCGIAAGDALLKQCALLFRQVTNNDTLVARIGNDEFAILLLDCTPDDAKNVANEIIESIKRFSFPWGERRLKIGISIGGEVVDHESSSEIEVLVAAAFSCAAAKESGRNRVFFQYQHEKLYQRRQAAEWEPKIVDALDHDGFCLHYQHIVSTREIEHGYRHYEALIRMIDSKGDLIFPGKFIPTAEIYGLIDDIDRWVIRRVIADIMSLKESEKHDLRISINLSGPTISDENFMGFLLDIIDETGIDPHYLQFEITETAAIKEFDRALELIHALKARGCYFSLDDFGTGLSSLGYLKQMPVDYLKIDGSFIRNMELNDVDFSMVSTINHLAHVMGILTIAECVENQTQLAMLREIGVDCVQGFFLDKPKPLSEIKF